MNMHISVLNMTEGMATVSDSVRIIVNESPFYSTIIKSGLGNFASIARRIKPSVEILTGETVKLNTIVKVLSTFDSNTESVEDISLLKKSKLAVEYKYKEYDANNVSEITEGTFLAFRTDGHYRCLISSDDEGEMALLRIILPELASGRPGLTLFIVQYLSIHGFKVKNIYRFDREIVLTANMRDAGKVVELVSNLLYSS